MQTAIPTWARKWARDPGWQRRYFSSKAVSNAIIQGICPTESQRGQKRPVSRGQKPRQWDSNVWPSKDRLTLCWNPGCRAGFPGGSAGKESTCNAGDPCLIYGWGRSPGEENGNPLQYSCLEYPMDRGDWWATVYGVAKSWTWLSD